MKYFFSALLVCLTIIGTHAQNIVLNNTFGNKGVVIKSPEKKDNVFSEWARSVIELPDEKLLLSIDANAKTVLTRYLPNGTLDKTYGRGGFSDLLPAAQSQALRGEGGKVTVIGVGSSGADVFFVVGRYTENGELDASFGNNGIKKIPLQTSGIEIRKMIFQKDGKILLAGGITHLGKSQGFVLRLTADGTPDVSFSNAGMLYVDVPGISVVSDVATSGNKILVGASSSNGLDKDFAVVQYLENGTPDPNFGNGGLSSVNVNVGDNLEAMAVQSDGKIIIAGEAGEYIYSGSNFTLVRLLPNGQVDSTFNQTGITSVTWGSSNHLLRNVVVDGSGRIIVAGFLQDLVQPLLFARFTADGNLDTQYGDYGKKLMNIGMVGTNLYAGTLTKNGSFVVAGLSYPFTIPNATTDYLLVRLNSNGQPDAEFGNGGLVTSYFPGKSSSISSPNLFSDGSVLFKYFAYGTTAATGLVRLHPDGTEDPNFGEEGLLKTSANFFVVLPDDHIVTFEPGLDPSTNVYNIVMSRYTKDGKPDPSLGGNGRKALSLPTYVTFNGFVLQTDGNFLLTGTSYGPNYQQQGYMAKIDADGNIDKQFGADGKVLFDLDLHEYPLQPVVQPDGKILVQGFVSAAPDFTTRSFIRRFSAEGKLDESFGNRGTVSIEPTGFAIALLIQSDGKLLTTVAVSGDNQQSYNVLLRYNTDGSPDKTFGQNGSVRIASLSAVLLKNDKILLDTNISLTGESNVALKLLNADGSIDKSFGTNGTKLIDLGSSNYILGGLSLVGNEIFIFGVKSSGLDQEGVLVNLQILYSPISDTTISGFTLINATADKDVQELKDGDVLDVSLLPRASLGIRANTNPANVGSVVFELKRDKKFKRTENGAPYSLFSDNNGDYFGGALPEGEYTLTATPYSKNDGKGNKGKPLTIHFKIVYPAAVTHFTLLNAQTGDEIGELKDGDQINLAALSTKLISIRANTSPDTVGSVVFALAGQSAHQQTENLLPYALFGGDAKQYTGWAPEAGNYTLTATPYSAPKGAGTKGKGHSVHFTVVTEGKNNCTTPSFVPVVTTAADLHRYATVADFNGDGKPDLALQNRGATGFSIYIGKGDGSFAQPNTYPVNAYITTAVAAGDFNGDGKTDLVIGGTEGTSDGNDFVTLFPGKGNGSFGDTLSFRSGGSFPIAIITSDFNKDGKLDLAVSNAQSHNIGILLGKGNGSFQPVITHETGSESQGLAAADFNGDGKTDLVLTDFLTGTVGVMPGNGDGSFGKLATFATGGNRSYGVVAADFNGDNKQDVAIVNFGTHNLSVLLGKGDGTFSDPNIYSTGDSDPALIVTADLNGDNNKDLVVNRWSGQAIVAFMGKGDGSFGQALPLSGESFSRWVLAADFNADGKVDLSFGPNDINVLLNTCGEPTFTATTGLAQKQVRSMLDKTNVALTASPNPFTSQSTVHFSVPTSANTTLSVYNASGIEVTRLYQGKAEGGKEYRVSLERKGFPAGIYLLKLTTGEQTVTAKVVIH